MSLNNYYKNKKIYNNDKYNLKCFFLNKNLNIKKNYNFFFKSITNYKFMNKFFTNFSLFNYYLYLLKKDYIYINILNIHIGSVKVLTYQYIYPS